MKLEDYPEWVDLINQLAKSSGIVLLLGATDVGKSTFTALLSNAITEGGRSLAIVDSDIGQSDIGPPSCVGLGYVEDTVRLLSEIPVSATAFVGTTSPHGAMIELISGTVGLASRALSSGAESVIIDTTGAVSGTSFQRLKLAKINLLKPAHIVAIQRSGECEHILRCLQYRAGLTIHRIAPADVISHKSPLLRKQRRTMKFSRAFRDAVSHAFHWDRVSLVNTWLASGATMLPHELQFLSRSLGTTCYHAERTSNHLGIVSTTEAQYENGWAAVQEQYRLRNITLTPLSRYENLLVGLADVNDHLLGLGSIEKIDFRSQTVDIVTQVSPAMAIAIVYFGLIRIRPDGSQAGLNPPGSL